MSRHSRSALEQGPPDPTGEELPPGPPPSDFPQPDRQPQGTNTTPPAKKERRGLDPELQTMAKIDAMLADLDDDAWFRVLSWLASRNKCSIVAHRASQPMPKPGDYPDPAKGERP